MTSEKNNQKNESTSREFEWLAIKAISFSILTLALLVATFTLFPDVIAELAAASGTVIFGALAYNYVNKFNGWPCLQGIPGVKEIPKENES